MLVSYVMLLWKSADIWVTHESYVCFLRCQDIQQLSLVSHLVSYVCIVIEGQCHMFYMFAICLYFYQISWHMSHILSHMFWTICLICSVICVIYLSYVSQKIAIFWKIFDFQTVPILYIFVICYIFFRCFSYVTHMFVICHLPSNWSTSNVSLWFHQSKSSWEHTKTLSPN